LIPRPFSWDRFGSKAEIDGLFRELQKRHLHFVYQGGMKHEVELWTLTYSVSIGWHCLVKKIYPDFHTSIPLGEENKQYVLAALRYLFIFLDGEEAHKGKQADDDWQNDQFIKDQGSIGLRFPYRAPLSETWCREIVDQIEAKYREAMRGDS
jgi:hypothetical protein